MAVVANTWYPWRINVQRCHVVTKKLVGCTIKITPTSNLPIEWPFSPEKLHIKVLPSHLQKVFKSSPHSITSLLHFPLWTVNIMALKAGVSYTLTSASANNVTAYLSRTTDTAGNAYGKTAF